MEWMTRALMLATLLAATATSAQKAAAPHRVQFSGSDAAFGVVATASAQVALAPPFLRVPLQGARSYDAIARNSSCRGMGG